MNSENKRITDPKDLSKTVMSDIDSFLDEIADFIQSDASRIHISNGNVDTGFLLRSINVERMPEKKIVHFSAPYSGNLEYGGFPRKMDAEEREEIRKWVVRKLGKREEESYVIARRICNKIEKVGTRKYPFIRPAITNAKVKYTI